MIMSFLERVESRISSLYQQAQARLDQAVSSRLRLLTTISAIFLPLTLLSGIYGMNFESMPELHWRFGYAAVLIAMLAMATGTLLYFRRRGWFK